MLDRVYRGLDFKVTVSTINLQLSIKVLKYKHTVPTFATHARFISSAHFLIVHTWVCLLCYHTGRWLAGGCYLNWGFINRPVYCCSRQRDRANTLTNLRWERSGDTHTFLLAVKHTLVHFYWRTPVSPLLCDLHLLLLLSSPLSPALTVCYYTSASAWQEILLRHGVLGRCCCQL